MYVINEQVPSALRAFRSRSENGKTKMRKPLTRQVCAIAKEILTRDPSIDDASWKFDIKARIAKLGFTEYPSPEELSTAMGLVERELERKQGPRPIAGIERVRPRAALPEQPSTDQPLSREQARAALAKLRERFPALAPRSMPSGESELMTTRERYATVSIIEQLRSVLALRRANREAQRKAEASEGDHERGDANGDIPGTR